MTLKIAFSRGRVACSAMVGSAAESAFRRQTGMVLVIALLALALLSIGAVALVRSVDNATVLAGNVSFKEATLSIADLGVEKAIEFLQSPPAGAIGNNGYDKGWRDVTNSCNWVTDTNCQYYPKQLSSDFYSTAKPQTAPSPSLCNPALKGRVPNGVPICAMWLGTGVAIDWPNVKGYANADDARIPAGYTIRFVIDRLCSPLSSNNSAWDPSTAPTDFTQTPPTAVSMVQKYCRQAALSARVLGSNAADHVRFRTVGFPTIYRITVQVTGPRNTETYIQALPGQ